MILDKHFLGKNGFVWWFGTVESNSDPLALGRCRVRITGWHNEDPNQFISEALPWAYPLTSLSNTGAGGVGTSQVGPMPGSRVFGFFLDGNTGQQPMMLASISGSDVIESRKSLEYGSQPSLPIVKDSIISTIFPNIVSDKETGAISDDVSTASNATNQTIVNQSLLSIDKGEWVLPMTGFVNSAYAEGRAGYTHKGVDICPAGFFRQTDPGAKHLRGRMRGPTGQPVYAAADGEVVFVWTADKGQGQKPTTYDLNGQGTRSYGNGLAIKHTLSTGTYITIYGHMGISQDPTKDVPGAGILVRRGDKVKKGQQIGSCGRSHNRDTPTHLHFEIRVGASLPAANNHINPGRIFPQLLNRHTQYVSWVDSTPKYNIEELPFSASNAPVIAGTGPKIG